MQLTASRITPRGRAWLREARAARPLHVFQEVCNLVDGEGRVISLQSERVPLSPISLAIGETAEWRAQPAGFGGWVAGDGPAVVKRDRIQVGGLTVLLEGAELWQPRPDWMALRVVDWEAAAPTLVRRLRRDSPEGGLAPLVDEHGRLADAAGAVAGQQGMAADIVAAAQPAAARLMEALRGEDRQEMEKTAGALAGLGAGLTPSGDDFLIGVMHALWLRRSTTGAERLSGWVARAAAPRTTPLSGAWLRAAAAGETTELWHELFRALRVDDAGRQEEITGRLLRVGHSSGSDALAGFLLALRVL